MWKAQFLTIKQANWFTHSHARAVTKEYIGETSRSVADKMKEHTRITKRHPKNKDERTKLERSSAITLHVLETEHHVDFDNPEILSKYWSIYRDRMNAEQWFISHQKPKNSSFKLPSKKAYD